MLWVIFSLSFLVALTGAMTPGPLLTYTVAASLATRRRAFLTGAWVIVGHGLLESILIAALLLGFAEIVRSPLAVKGIGVVGGLFLIVMGGAVVRNVLLRRSRSLDLSGRPSGRSVSHPIIGGVLVSMSNPYWWVWWATVGFAFMSRYEITFSRWAALLAFFLGHEAGDLAWYLTVSTAVHLGRNRLSPKLYGGVLLGCGVFVSLFGLYLGLSPFLESAS